MLTRKLALVSALAFTHVAFTSAKYAIRTLYYDSEKYYTNIIIGDPAQTFLVALDTDSTLTWVHGVECPDVDCTGTRFNNFGDVASKGYRHVGNGYEQFYSSDAMNKKNYVAGFLGTDTVKLYRFTVEQDFVPVFESHKVFKEYNEGVAVCNPEGLLGLGMSSTISTRDIKTLKSVSKPRPYTSFLLTLAEKGSIDKSFSLFFVDSKVNDWVPGEFILGGYSAHRIPEGPHYIPVYRSQEPDADFHWQVFGQAFKVSGVELDTTSSVIYEERFQPDKNEIFRFATANPYSKIRPSYNHQLYRALTGKEPKEKHNDEKKSYIIECKYADDKTKRLSIAFSHQQDSKTDPKPVLVDFPLAKLVRPYYDKAGKKQQGCLWGPQDADPASQEMYLGLDILRNIYMIFDFKEYRIGLAAERNTPTKIVVE